jgi:outer membrane biogenesis lipoprotein LolB
MKEKISVLLTACLFLFACTNSSDNSSSNNDRTGSNQDSGAIPRPHSLELVFSDNTYQLTGVAKEEGGKLLVNYPR